MSIKHEGNAHLSIVTECLNLQRTNAAVDDETIKNVSALAYAGTVSYMVSRSSVLINVCQADRIR